MYVLKKLRTILQSLGLPAKDYACHSFCKGGASFAFQAGIPVELIKILGDWHSDTVLLYINNSSTNYQTSISYSPC